ncbi:MAG: MraY family glycosyltransferase [Planctomycetota bacterium]
MIALLIAAGAGTALLTALFGLPVRRLARAWGYVDRPDGARKLHGAPMPYGGGLAMIAAFLAVCGGLLVVARFTPPGLLPADTRVHLAGLGTRLNELYIIAGAAVLMGLLGFLDDIKPVREILKLALEIFFAAALWWVGIRITGHIPSAAASFVLTVLWITGIANAFNFLDNMDGLCATVTLITALLFALFGLQTGQLFIAGYYFVVAGLALGFLVFNFPPATMFMGDCGSLFLGFLMAAGAVESTWYFPQASNRILPLVAPLLILAVPIFDTASVIWIRLRLGRPVLKGDRNHFSHRLQRLGLSPHQTLATIALVAAGVGFSAFYLVRLSTAGAVLALVQGLCVFLVIVILEKAGGRKEAGD